MGELRVTLLRLLRCTEDDVGSWVGANLRGFVNHATEYRFYTPDNQEPMEGY